MKPCKWYKRLINVIIDFFTIELFTMIFLTIIKAIGINVKFKIEIGILEIYYISLLSFLIIFIVYYYIFEAIYGRTLGKIITKTRVFLLNNNNNKWIYFFYRTISRLLIFEIFWFLKNTPRGLHDVFSGTIVVDK